MVVWLHGHASDEVLAGKAHFGIETVNALGIPNALLRPLARKIKRDHQRALDLWETGIREAQLLACFTDEPGKVTVQQALNWAEAFDSWDIVDHAAALFIEARLHEELIALFVADDREYVRRAGFAMIAWGALHLKKEPDSIAIPWLSLIEDHAGDDRNFVKKAVNWALRQIGKRSLVLHAPALELAQKLERSNNRSERWIGRDAAKELSSQSTIDRLDKKAAQHPARGQSGAI
ncbi:MAG: DNA alkylation repair protein [Rhizobiaceae bacterium]|nr:DNA alkylation repair protein [Rhizobiaceae bacterium]